jgi:hypothetical protein
MMTAFSDGMQEQVFDSMSQGLRFDFTNACTKLAEVRQRQRAKDTPAHRGAVLESNAWIDAILDTYLLYRRSSTGACSRADC